MPTATSVPPSTLDRVRLGNEKFNEQWKRAKDTAEDPSRWGRNMDQMAAAFPRLDWLCHQLIAEGYTGCLYPAGEHQCTDSDWICWVCPKGD